MAEYKSKKKVKKVAGLTATDIMTTIDLSAGAIGERYRKNTREWLRFTLMLDRLELQMNDLICDELSNKVSEHVLEIRNIIINDLNSEVYEEHAKHLITEDELNCKTHLETKKSK